MMRTFDGSISANLHESHDGRRVVNYAQRRSMEGSYDPVMSEVAYVGHA